MPPPDTSLRKRSGYNALASSEDDENIAFIEPQETDALHTPPAAEVVQEKEGWSALTWSFAASGIMTVSTVHRLDCVEIVLTAVQLAAYFFPVVFTIPLFGTYLASHWLWTFTPSLSYIGQGIIMGFPTTLSMNLVRSLSS